MVVVRRLDCNFESYYFTFQPERGTPLGGPYIAVHFRRRDYLYARKEKIPSLEWAAKQLEKVKIKTAIKKNVFVCQECIWPHLLIGL